MFSILNKASEIGVRFSKEWKANLMGAVMKGYLLIPEKMLDDLEGMTTYFTESYHYVMSLEPK